MAASAPRPRLYAMSESASVLVAYGSRHGATAEIAAAIGESLRAAGLEADVVPAARVRSLEGYRAVVLGSAVYARAWRPEAIRLLSRAELRELDVWLFSSGPVGEGFEDAEKFAQTATPARVLRIAAEIHAHEHVVFGGMVADDEGFIRKRMARGIPPERRDLRDWPEIATWAESIAATLTGVVSPPAAG
jgi:menaquinone-dependent protoporphyrinogen oxidase